MQTTFVTVAPKPMFGPLPWDQAFVVKGRKTVTVDAAMARICKTRAERMAPEYWAHMGAAFTVHDSLEEAEALLGWVARIHGSSEPVAVWLCSDTGRYQIGY
jgi:hypothetical protein